MSGQFERSAVKGGSSQTNLTKAYLLITPASINHWGVDSSGSSNPSNPSLASGWGIKPSLNLKSNVIITGGDGTKDNPFTLS